MSDLAGVLQPRLLESRDRIVASWIEKTLGTRTCKPGEFLMGSVISTEIGSLFDSLLMGAPPDEVAPHLDRIVEITCIQDTPPSRAVSFVFELKKVLREELSTELRDPVVAEQFVELMDRIDKLALLAFESHARSQKKIADIRVLEARRRASSLLRMTKLGWDDLPTCEPTRGEHGP